MKYKVGDRVKVIVYGGIKGTIIEIRETKSAYKYKIHFDNRYLLDAYYTEDELQPLNEKIIDYNIISNLTYILNELNAISEEVNNIINNIDNNK